MYLPVFLGVKVWFARSIATIMDDMIVAKPTILVSVPRIYEKIYSKLMSTVEDSLDCAYINLGRDLIDYFDGKSRLDIVIEENLEPCAAEMEHAVEKLMGFSYDKDQGRIVDILTDKLGEKSLGNIAVGIAAVLPRLDFERFELERIREEEGLLAA